MYPYAYQVHFGMGWETDVSLWEYNLEQHTTHSAAVLIQGHSLITSCTCMGFPLPYAAALITSCTCLGFPLPYSAAPYPYFFQLVQCTWQLDVRWRQWSSWASWLNCGHSLSKGQNGWWRADPGP